jgi:sulfur carrier protein
VIWLNGEETDGLDGATVDALLGTLPVDPQRRGVAVAVDDEVVPRTEWATTIVPAGARVEVLTAMQGG